MEAVLPILQPAPVALAPQPGRIADSELPDSYHETYRLKMAGLGPSEIGKRQGICRTQVWRRCRAVETEFVAQLESKPVFNILAEECKRLLDIEEKARQAAEATTSSRSKAAFYAEARRCCVARTNLYLSTGILPRIPDQIFKVVGTFKPAEMANQSGPKRSREQIIEDLIETMSKTRVIQ